MEIHTASCKVSLRVPVRTVCRQRVLNFFFTMDMTSSLLLIVGAAGYFWSQEWFAEVRFPLPLHIPLFLSVSEDIYCYVID